jgi:hypothetical protein
MNDYENGEIWGWNGGECPVHPETKIKIWTRNALICSGLEVDASACEWKHGGSGNDIVCFQVTKVHVEPKVIYVNEWGSGWGYSYPTEEDAKKNAGAHHIRTAVEYVEKQK